MANRKRNEPTVPLKPVGYVSPEAFITAWQNSSTVSEVMRETFLPRTAVHSRAAYYRRRGVPLKQLNRRGAPRANWAALAQLAKECA